MNRVRTVTMLYFYYFIFVFNEIYLRQAGKQTSQRRNTFIVCPWFLCVLFRTLLHILDAAVAVTAAALLPFFVHKCFLLRVTKAVLLLLSFAICHTHHAPVCFCVICSFDALSLNLCAWWAATNFRARIKHPHTPTHFAYTEMKIYICANVIRFDSLFPLFPAHSRSTFAHSTHSLFIFIHVVNILHHFLI